MKIIKTSEALPKSGRYVLAWLEGAKIPMRAMWAAQHTLPLGDDADPEWGEYSEEKDEYFCPAGWYEMNQHEEQHWGVDGNVVAWCELPRLDHQCLAQIDEPAQPVCWIRFCSDGSTEGPIMHSQICEARKTSGAWTPLYAGAAPAAVAGPAWDKTRRDLAIVMMGFAGNPSRSLEVAEIVLDAATEPGAPMAYLRAPAAPALEAPAAPAVPAGFALVPLRLTRAMDEAISEEGRQWEDLLAAAQAVTEEQYEASAQDRLSRDEVRAIFLECGFVIKEGQTDLKPYVYEAAQALESRVRSIAAAAPQAPAAPDDVLCYIRPGATLPERHGFEVCRATDAGAMAVMGNGRAVVRAEPASKRIGQILSPASDQSQDMGTVVVAEIMSNGYNGQVLWKGTVPPVGTLLYAAPQAAPAAPAVDAELLELAQAIVKYNRQHGGVLAVHINNLADLVDEHAAQAKEGGEA